MNEAQRRAMYAKHGIKGTIKAYDVKAKKMVEMLEPQEVRMKNGRYAMKGKSAVTGNTVFRILGSKK